MGNCFADKKVVVTGGAGFLGSHVVERLRENGCSSVIVPRRRDYDLRRREDVDKLFRNFRPQVLIHLAVSGGGIGANLVNPGAFFYDNSVMGIQLIEKARRESVEKVVVAGTVCSYPKNCPVPFQEEDLWNGYPEETNAPYGLAKRMLLVQGQAYRQQYGLNSIHLLIANLYGPRDNFHPETSHVIPALIRKFVHSARRGCPSVTCWGDGSPSRDFLYVEDAAEGIVLATERYNEPSPVNLASGKEVKIRGLVDLIGRMTGFTGKVIWDTSKPNGQPRRCVDPSKAEAAFGFCAKASLEDGIRKTVKWFIDHGEGMDDAKS